MSPTITLSDDTFKKLQTLAKPFVDTPESVIAELAENEIRRRGNSTNGHVSTVNGDGSYLKLNPDAHENLTHTRLLAATIDGRPIHRPKWNGILDELHIRAHQRLKSFDAVRKITSANIREGRYEESGYRYLPQADFSIQGVDANMAWDHSLLLARALGVSIELRFEWRNKEGAARPGEVAELAWAPDKN